MTVLPQDVSDAPPVGHGVSLRAALCLLRARALEAMEARSQAATWYQAALQVRLAHVRRPWAASACGGGLRSWAWMSRGAGAGLVIG